MEVDEIELTGNSRIKRESLQILKSRESGVPWNSRALSFLIAFNRSRNCLESNFEVRILWISEIMFLVNCSLAEVQLNLKSLWLRWNWAELRLPKTVLENFKFSNEIFRSNGPVLKPVDIALWLWRSQNTIAICNRVFLDLYLLVRLVSSVTLLLS